MESSPQSSEPQEATVKNFGAANEPSFSLDSSTGKEIPGFSYDDAKFMIASAHVPEQAPASQEVSHVMREPEHLEAPAIPPSPTLHVREKVLRSTVGQKTRALAAAALVGIGGAAATDNAQAGAFENSVKNAGKAIAVNMVNKALGNSPVGVTLDRHGNPVLAPRSPAQMALERPVNYEPGVREYAASIGIDVIERGLNFSILNRNDLSDPGQLTIKKSESPTRYTTNLTLQKAPGGGLLLTDSYMFDGIQKTEIAIIRMGQNGRIQSLVTGK